MTKTELIKELEKRARLPHGQAEAVVNICFRSIVQSLYDDERIELRGFGSFSNKNYKGYQGYHPRNGKPIDIPPKKSPTFRVSEKLQKDLNRKKSPETHSKNS